MWFAEEAPPAQAAVCTCKASDSAAFEAQGLQCQPAAPASHMFCPPAATNRENLHKLLYKRLDELLRLAKARKTVMFALDGPAPLAKLLTQR